MSRLPRRLVASCLLGLLAACQAPAATPTRARPATPAPAKAVETAASARPAAPAKPALLQAPAGGHKLTGKVELEPAYMLATQRGKLISNDGGSVLAVGGALISQDGAGLISQDGGGLVAQGGGNVVAPAQLISQDGGGLISQDGAGLISQDGAGALPAPAFHLMQAAELTRDYAPVPAAGAAVYLRSLMDGRARPLGQDAGGKPAYALYTNMRGEFELWVPEGQDQTVELVAFMPGARQDRHQRYSLLTNANATAPVLVDDDTSAVAAYVRAAFQSVVLPVIEGDRAAIEQRFQAAARIDDFKLVLDRYVAAAAKAELGKRPRAEREAIAAAITDRVLAYIDLSKAMVDRAMISPFGNTYKPITEAALPLLGEMLREKREEVALQFVRLKAEGQDPVEHFSHSPTIDRLSRRDLDAGLITSPYRIEYPSDFGAFIALAMVGRGSGDDANGVALTLGTYETEVGLSIDSSRGQWFMGALSAISTQLGTALFFHEAEIMPLFEGN